MQEVWKDVVGYEGLYQVSNLGRVKKIKSNSEHKILKLSISKQGYLVVNLNRKTNYVHRLVYESFYGIKSVLGKYVIDHIDNDRLNANINNLQCILHGSNISKSNKKRFSKYPGICYDVKCNTWIVEIVNNGVKIKVGRFKDIEEAKNKYEIKIKEISNNIIPKQL